jgi:hypothetical protein
MPTALRRGMPGTGGGSIAGCAPEGGMTAGLQSDCMRTMPGSIRFSVIFQKPLALPKDSG